MRYGVFFFLESPCCFPTTPSGVLRTYPFPRVLRFLSGAPGHRQHSLVLKFYDCLQFEFEYTCQLRSWFWLGLLQPILPSLCFWSCYGGHSSLSAFFLKILLIGIFRAPRSADSGSALLSRRLCLFNFCYRSAVPGSALLSAPVLSILLCGSFRALVFPCFCSASPANILPWSLASSRPVHRRFAGLSRIFLASGFAWICVSEFDLAQFLHSKLSSNCWMEPGPAHQVPLHPDRLLNGIIMSFLMFLFVRFTLPACGGFFLGLQEEGGAPH